jgi:hypothetical protein
MIATVGEKLLFLLLLLLLVLLLLFFFVVVVVELKLSIILYSTLFSPLKQTKSPQLYLEIWTK